MTDVETLPGHLHDDVLQLAASEEARSEHPLAGAILAAASERGLVRQDPDDFESITGTGVRAVVNGRHIAIGTRRLLSEAGTDPSPLGPIADRLSDAGKTAMLVAIDGRPAVVLAAADTIKPDAASAVAAV